ncbi:MAG: cupin domain-containing protein [Actinomycetota bacterium]|nr:cupin domain-containing protein [Actinomycetota bacterium]
MARIEQRSSESHDEMRTPDKTNVAVVNLGPETAARLAARPGWKWSECIKPVGGGDLCQTRHVGEVQSGRLHIAPNDGTKGEVDPGDAYFIEPGHVACVVRDEKFVGFDFETKTTQDSASS